MDKYKFVLGLAAIFAIVYLIANANMQGIDGNALAAGCIALGAIGGASFVRHKKQ